jgi:hypothetical protein
MPENDNNKKVEEKKIEKDDREKLDQIKQISKKVKGDKVNFGLPETEKSETKEEKK